MAVGTTPQRGDFCEKWPNVVEISELDRQNCKNLWNVAKKNYILVGLGKIFSRSVKNFGRSGQFWKVWKKIWNVREKISEKMYEKKSRRSKILATRGRGDFVKFYLAPPKMRVAPQMPPQIPRPGAATGWHRFLFVQWVFLGWFVTLKKTIWENKK